MVCWKFAEMIATQHTWLLQHKDTIPTTQMAVCYNTNAIGFVQLNVINRCYGMIAGNEICSLKFVQKSTDEICTKKH
jgi:hypothetical protein